MSTNCIQGAAVSRLGCAFKLKPLSRRLAWTHATLLGLVVCIPLQANAADEHKSVQLAPMVITGVGQQSPLVVVTDPRIPRQPIPASEAADY